MDSRGNMQMMGGATAMNVQMTPKNLGDMDSENLMLSSSGASYASNDQEKPQVNLEKVRFIQ